MVLNLVLVHVYRYEADGVAFGLCDESCVSHVPEHEIAALQGIFRMEDRIVSGRLVYHTDKHRALFYIEVGRALGKEGLGRRINSIRAASEEDGVEIHCQNLVLCIVALDLDCGNPLLELDSDHLHLAPTGNAGV